MNSCSIFQPGRQHDSYYDKNSESDKGKYVFALFVILSEGTLMPLLYHQTQRAHLLDLSVCAFGFAVTGDIQYVDTEPMISEHTCRQTTHIL